MGNAFFNGMTALVTGASSGLGEAFARTLARQVRKLVLVARREDRLVLLRAELVAAHPNLEEVRVARVDLADPVQRAGFAEAECGEIDLLINNAGVGDYGALAGADWTRTARMIELNVTALTHLARAVLPGMQERRRGGIINVGSLAGEVFMPDFAVYAASKAYVAWLSEALRIEGHSHGIRVVAVCPGPVHTEFGTNARRAGEQKGDVPLYRWIYTSPQEVVDAALTALEAGRPRVFPNWRVRMVAAGIHALPMALKRLLLSRRPRRSTTSSP